MVNEIYSANEGIDAGESVRQDISKVTEQDVKRAQWDAAQVKKAQEEIKKSKAKNNNIAKFLAFLLKNIKNEELISKIYNTFFRITDHRTNTTYIKKVINDIVVVWFFAPFFPNEIAKFGLNSYFDGLIDNDTNKNMGNYLEYIKKLSKKYHDNIPINKESLLELIALILSEFKVINKISSDIEKEKTLKEIKKRLQ